MECGPSSSSDAWLPSSLTDADFQALSLEAASSRAQLQLDGSAIQEQEATRRQSIQEEGDSDSTQASFEAIAMDVAILHRNLSVAELMEHALLQGEGGLSDRGALCVKTLPYNGTTASSFYRVQPELPNSSQLINSAPGDKVRAGTLQPMDVRTFDALYDRAVDYSRDRTLYQYKGGLPAELDPLPSGLKLRSLVTHHSAPAATASIQVFCELASQALLIRQWFGEPEQQDPGRHQGDASRHGRDKHGHNKTLPLHVSCPPKPRLTIIVLPGLRGEPLLEPCIQTEVFVAVDAVRRIAILGGSRYGGDLLGAITTLWAEVQALAPRTADQRPPLLLQAAAFSPLRTSQQQSSAISTASKTAPTPSPPASAAIFLGTAGSGKQALASSLSQHWQRGPLHWHVQNSLQPLLQGNYGRITGTEPEQAQLQQIQQQLGFGSLLENVPLDEHSSRPCYGDRRWGQVMTAAWPNPKLETTHSSRNRSDRSVHYVPQAIFLLVADTSGVLPLLAKLTPAQAVYQAALAYGAALPGWERQLQQPEAIFGAVDVQKALRESLGLQDRLRHHPQISCYLLNTGWLGSRPNTGRCLNQRINLATSRALVKAALAHRLSWSTTTPLAPIFNWALPMPANAADSADEESELWSRPWQFWPSQPDWQSAAEQLAKQFEQQMRSLVTAGLPEEIALQQWP